MKSDLCCGICRSSLGVCRSRYTCDHHREFAKQDEADAKARRTYRDPTAAQAIHRADRSRKGKGQ